MRVHSRKECILIFLLRDNVMKIRMLLFLMLHCYGMGVYAALPPTLPPRKRESSQSISPPLNPRKLYPTAEEIKKHLIELLYKNKKEEPTCLHFSSFDACAMESVPHRSEAVSVCDGNDGFMVKKFSFNETGITTANAPNDPFFACVSCTCSGDGAIVAFGSGPKIILYKANPWNAHKGFLVSGLKGNVSALALNKTGNMVLFSQGKESHFGIRNLDSSTIKEYENNVQHDVYRMAFSPNEQQFVSVSKDRFVIWNIQEDEIVKSYEARIGTCYNCKIEYCGDTEWFLTGYNHVLNVWTSHDLNNIEIKKQIALENYGLSKSEISVNRESKQGLYAYDRSSCGKYIFVEDADKVGCINIFNLESANRLKTINTKKKQIFSLLYVAEGKLLVAGIEGNNSEVSLYDFIDNADQEALSALTETKGSDRELIQGVLDPSFVGYNSDFDKLPMKLQVLLKKYISSLNDDIWHVVEPEPS